MSETLKDKDTITCLAGSTVVNNLLTNLTLLVRFKHMSMEMEKQLFEE